jgi:hypothetical protein
LVLLYVTTNGSSLFYRSYFCTISPKTRKKTTGRPLRFPLKTCVEREIPSWDTQHIISTSHGITFGNHTRFQNSTVPARKLPTYQQYHHFLFSALTHQNIYKYFRAEACHCHCANCFTQHQIDGALWNSTKDFYFQTYIRLQQSVTNNELERTAYPTSMFLLIHVEKRSSSDAVTTISFICSRIEKQDNH